MVFSQHSDKFPRDISEYFLSSWKNEELWGVRVPHSKLAIDELGWHLDYPFLSSNPPLPLFDLIPREVLSAPHRFPRHWDRVVAADLAFPLVISEFGGRLVILDGIHRLLKSMDAGAHVLECKVVSRDVIRTAA
jgi:hypothetical protein